MDSEKEAIPIKKDSAIARQEKLVAISLDTKNYPNTEVLMADGSSKNIDDIEIGEFICGDDNIPRKVINKTVKSGKIHQVNQIRKQEANHYYVDDSHLLVLCATGINPRVGRGSSGDGYRLVYYRKCTKETCDSLTCSKRGFKQKEIGYKTEKEANQAKDCLMTGSLDPNYVQDGDKFEMTVPEFNNLCSKDAKTARLKGYKVSFSAFKNEGTSSLPTDPYTLGQRLA